MTRKAVENFIGRGVISDRFREKFMAGQMTIKEIAAVDRGLDDRDVHTIVIALMFADDFPGFSSEIDLYINRRYSSGRPAGDNLPISV